MRASLRFLGAAVLTAALAAPASAQGGGGGRGGFGGGFGQNQAPTSVDPAATRDAELLREIHLVRVLSQGKFPRELLQQLRDVVAGAQGQRKQNEADAAARLRQGEPLLEEAKKAVMAGNHLDGPSPQERTFASGSAQINGQVESLNRQLQTEIRKVLEASPEAKTAAAAAGAALVREQRAQQAGGRGGFGGPGRSARDLDQLRNAAPQDYPNQRLQFAMRNANVQGWRQFGNGAFAAPGGGPASTAGAASRGFRGPGTPPDPNDPALQAQLRPFLAMADQVRAMPPAIYQQSAGRLAQQLDAARTQARVNAPVPDDQALDALARALTGPEALPALDAKLGRAGG